LLDCGNAVWLLTSFVCLFVCLYICLLFPTRSLYLSFFPLFPPSPPCLSTPTSLCIPTRLRRFKTDGHRYVPLPSITPHPTDIFSRHRRDLTWPTSTQHDAVFVYPTPTQTHNHLLQPPCARLSTCARTWAQGITCPAHPCPRLVYCTKVWVATSQARLLDRVQPCATAGQRSQSGCAQIVKIRQPVGLRLPPKWEKDRTGLDF
jgi:hypothetical protein